MFLSRALPTKISAKISGVHFTWQPYPCTPALACACRPSSPALRAFTLQTCLQTSAPVCDDRNHPTMAPSLASIPDAYLWLGLGTSLQLTTPSPPPSTNLPPQASSPSSPPNKSPTASAPSYRSPRSEPTPYRYRTPTPSPNASPPTPATKKTPSKPPRSSRSPHLLTSTSAALPPRSSAAASTPPNPPSNSSSRT